MGIQDLQAFIDSSQIPGSSVPVDLLRIARGLAVKQSRQQQKTGKPLNHVNNKLSLVVDGECCLHRLYGGYFSDWVCGGQWNRMVQFLAILVQTIQTNNIELAVFFNGCLEQQRMNEWITSQLRIRQKINQVLKHINIKGTPPPKVWWAAPSCLRTCLRMALRHLSISVLCTMDDHHQEVIAYCRENCFYGLMADDGEYAVFDPPRYFSSEHIKLTYKGSLETKEYILSEVTKGLGLSSDRLCVVAALLGNYLLPEQDLLEFYHRLGLVQSLGKIPVDPLVKTVATYVKGLPSVENLDTIAAQIFGSTTDPRVSRFKQSVQYYLNGTKDGFLRYRTQAAHHRHGYSQFPAQKISPHQNKGKHVDQVDNSKFASETVESERDSLQAYNEATASSAGTPQIVIEPPGIVPDDKMKPNGSAVIDGSEEETGTKSGTNSVTTVNGGHSGTLIISVSSSSSSSSATSPSRTPENKRMTNQEDSPIKSVTLPTVPPEVMRTASERHQKGLMSPYIYQILTQGEIKLPVLMEDENHKDLPSIHLVFRPVRQMVYAILFNLHHYIYMASKQKEKGDEEKVEVPDICIKEWIWSKNNQYQTPDYVRAEQVGWGVPTIQRLWFGSAIDDKRRRLRAFLTCMRSDTPLMLNPTYVPQHLLVMASVLRFIMSHPEKILLHKIELDVFIAQAFSPALMNAHQLQELQLPMVTSRGVQLAALFMQGVETALLANDACGAPIPWLMCCPWLFFDGKLFHHKLARTSTAKSLLDLCEHRYEYVLKVERMRQAILEGLDIDYCIASVQTQLSGMRVRLPPNIASPPGVIPPPVRAMNAINVPERVYAPRGLFRRTVPSRGGQLEIAGVVVGSWGPNYGTRGVPQATGSFTPHRPSGGRVVPPQVTSVGGPKAYRQGNNMQGYHMNSLNGRPPTFQTRASSRHFGVPGRGKRNQSGAKKKSSGNKKGTRDAENMDLRNLTPPDTPDDATNKEDENDGTGRRRVHSPPIIDINGRSDTPNGSSQNLTDVFSASHSPIEGSVTVLDVVADVGNADRHVDEEDDSNNTLLAGVLSTNT
ncbi:constitutive coactivator of PPAR-gamma-like protein 1 [Schistocerca cancellata]|uniref:constitutive coactivator of PPAR-gamma-like protein 1 n=1 Tax=Schistocerca cancellata TaxID=274614 RepID=UPI002117790B|nr:constitutive coactivator of PPAR-gamma-like protein 1 [Schistocerca cancellata]